MEMCKRIEIPMGSGLIGKFNTLWEIMKRWNNETDEVFYELIIENKIVGNFPSVVSAMKTLIDQFDEQE